MGEPLALYTEPVFDRLSPDEQEVIIEVAAECLLAQALEDLAKKSETTSDTQPPQHLTPPPRPARAHLRLARSRHA